MMISTDEEVNKLASLASRDDGQAECYLCLDDLAGQPLRRDCACRGTDAGFVHLSCLAKFAAAKSAAWDVHEMKEFIQSWVQCPHCNQEYQNELRIDIATKFVSFVRNDSHHHQCDISFPSPPNEHSHYY
jgi:hypothetical protein